VGPNCQAHNKHTRSYKANHSWNLLMVLVQAVGGECCRHNVCCYQGLRHASGTHLYRVWHGSLLLLAAVWVRKHCRTQVDTHSGRHADRQTVRLHSTLAR
jgi:hypothetical protein